MIAPMGQPVTSCPGNMTQSVRTLLLQLPLRIRCEGRKEGGRLTISSGTQNCGPWLVVAVRADARVLELAGELDLACERKFRELVIDLATHWPEIVVDLGEVTFADCAGLGVIAALASELARSDNRLVVVHATPMVADMMKLLGHDHLVASR